MVRKVKQSYLQQAGVTVVSDKKETFNERELCAIDGADGVCTNACVDHDEANPVCIEVPLEKMLCWEDRICNICRVSVPYSKDQLEMAHQVIEQMRDKMEKLCDEIKDAHTNPVRY